MRPGRNNELILQGAKDRFYMNAAAQLTGDENLQEYIALQEEETFLELKEEACEDIREYGHLPDRQIGAIIWSREGARNKEAHRMAKGAFLSAEMPLHPDFTETGLYALKQLSEVSIPQAIGMLVRPSVAKAMLEEYKRARLKDAMG